MGDRGEKKPPAADDPGKKSPAASAGKDAAGTKTPPAKDKSPSPGGKEEPKAAGDKKATKTPPAKDKSPSPGGKEEPKAAGDKKADSGTPKKTGTPAKPDTDKKKDKKKSPKSPEAGEKKKKEGEKATKTGTSPEAIREAKEMDIGLPKIPEARFARSKPAGETNAFVKFCRHMGVHISQFLGLRDDYTMMLWKENFVNRTKAADFGINFRLSVTCGRKGVRSPLPGDQVIEHKPAPEQKITAMLGFPVLLPPATEEEMKQGVPVEETQLPIDESQLKSGPEAIKAYKKIIKMECQMSQQPKRLDEILALAPDGIARIGLIPELLFEQEIRTMRGTETVERWDLPNPWIGPDLATFVAAGVVFSACMRRDKGAAHLRAYLREGETVGCCYHVARGRMGTTSEDECKRISVQAANWTEGRDCPLHTNPESNITILRPCCFGLLGNCKLATERHCRHINGIYHISSNVKYCSQVKCLEPVCMVHNKEDRPKYPRQWWRMLTSLAYHPGLLFCIPIVVIQWLVGSGIEAAIGTYRMAIIYIISAAGGNLVASTFNPYLPQMGGSGAVFGLLGLSTMEIAQAKLGPRGKLIRYLAKIATAATVLMLFGTFPLADNFQHVFGLVFCLLTAVTVCPHLSFNYWDVRSRRIIFGIALTLLLVVWLITLIVYFVIQDTHFCTKCSNFSCIPYNELMCSFAEHVTGTSHSV